MESAGNRISQLFLLLLNIWCDPHLKFFKNAWWDSNIFKEKELIIQLQIFHKDDRFNLLFPLRIDFPYLVFCWCIFWGDTCIAFSQLITFFLAKVELNVYLSCLSFSICPLLFYDKWWKIYSSMKIFEFVAPCSMFSFTKYFPHKKVSSCEKNRLVEIRLYTCVKWNKLHHPLVNKFNFTARSVDCQCFGV